MRILRCPICNHRMRKLKQSEMGVFIEYLGGYERGQPNSSNVNLEARNDRCWGYCRYCGDYRDP